MTPPGADASATPRAPLAWRLARRELRGSWRGFGVLVACLAIGVAAIAGAASLTSAIRGGMTSDSRALLGGDLELRLSYRAADADERAAFAALGRVAEAVEMRAMVHRLGDDRRTLVELKGVDQSYPLYGQLTLSPAATTAEALEPRDGVWGAAADSGLLTRLGLRLGDRVAVGDAVVELRATIEQEPDRVATLFAFGPRLMVDARAVAETGLVQPGSLVRWVYGLRLRPGLDAPAAKSALARQFPHAPWQVRDGADAAPGLQRFLDTMGSFLTVVGLTALLVGGIGVANAVKAFVDGRVATIAILKSLGAGNGLIFRVYLLQVALLALVGILLGLVVGALVPWAALAALGPDLPIRARLGVYPQALAQAAGFGALTTLAFALVPLARTADIPGAALFRDAVQPRRLRLFGGRRRQTADGADPQPIPDTADWSRRALAAALAAGAGLAALAVATAGNRLMAAGFVAGSVGALALFGVAAVAVRRAAQTAAARRAERAGRPVWRLALGNLHRPGGAVGSVVVSLGLGLTVLVGVALVEANLSRQLGERMPAQAPAFFFIDIQDDQAAAFTALVRSLPGATALQQAPMVRGRVTRINGEAVETRAVAPSVEWVLRGDRGLTAAATPPADARVVAGQWWAPDYHGAPLLSLDATVAHGLGVGLGDTVTVNVLGRDVTATVASLREIDWTSLGMNFTFILSPDALAGAPATWIAAVHAQPGHEAAVEKAVLDRFPTISAIPVRQALESVRRMVASGAVAVRAAAAVTLAAGALVLAGAIAASHRRRRYEAVVLKVLGATRATLAAAFLLEYAILGAATGAVAIALGTLGAWAVLTLVMHADWVFLPHIAATTVVACVAATMAIGFAGTWRALGAKVAPYLRAD